MEIMAQSEIDLSIIALIMQIPIIFGIIIYTKHLNTYILSFKKTNNFVFWGWVSNLVYIILKTTSLIFNFNDELFGINYNFFIKITATFFDYNTVILFIYASITHIRSITFRGLLSLVLSYRFAIFLIVLLLFCFIIEFYFLIYELEDPFFVKIIHSSCFFISLLYLSVFYYLIDKEHESTSIFLKFISPIHLLQRIKLSQSKTTFNSVQNTSMLTLGTFLYALIQFMHLINESSKNHVGFLLGFGTKFIIFLGLYKLIIFSTQNATDSTRLHRIVGRVFHEINPPLLEIKNIFLHQLLSSRSEVSNQAYSKIVDLDSSINRINAIINAAQTLYDSDKGIIIDPENPNESSLINTEASISVNTLLEIAVYNLKAISNNSIVFKINYSSKCDIFCNKYEIIQLFINILKNSYEAKEGSRSEIIIKTKKELIDGKTLVKIEILDNGIGISQDIFYKIFHEGFTTKQFGTGFGLSIVKEFIQNQGGYYEIESPYKNSGFKENNHGTKFSVYLNTRLN